MGIDLIGAVPDDESIVISTNQGEPLVGDDSLAGQAFMNICYRVTTSRFRSPISVSINTTRLSNFANPVPTFADVGTGL